MSDRLEMSPERMIEALNNEVRIRDKEIERLRSHVKELQYQVSSQYAEINRLVGRPADVDADLKDEDGFYK